MITMILPDEFLLRDIFQFTIKQYFFTYFHSMFYAMTKDPYVSDIWVFDHFFYCIYFGTTIYFIFDFFIRKIKTD